MVTTNESLQERKKRSRRVLGKLRKTYGEVSCALHHQDALQLLVATILSAQSTDKNVNKITPALFEEYKTAEDYANAERSVLEQRIHSTGFFRQKCKFIQGACRIIVEHYGGQVPETMDDLVRLPGVARKTANVVLGTWFGHNEGIVVDTHVGRLAWRMALTWRSKDSKGAVKIETDLMELLPRKDWAYFAHAMIHHGRLVCLARKPKCEQCALAKWCPSAGMFESS
ncbi:MAG: endonuclease III [Phycisphaerae bacterium]|nr:endonuclease III [Phycisphaerae bacterium]